MSVTVENCGVVFYLAQDNLRENVACVAWRLNQFERDERAAKPRGLSLSRAPCGFTARFRGFAAFLARSNCLKTAKLRRQGETYFFAMVMLFLHFHGSLSKYSYICFQKFNIGETVDVMYIGKDDLTGRPRISTKSLSAKTRGNITLDEFVATYLK